MRNLKRALSLTLASVMLLGMMVVGGSAAEGYPDVDESQNVEAIEVLQAVGVMGGDNNGNFNPDDYVTREQMAVIMSQLLKLDYNYYKGTNPFSDVPEWAAPYVAACAANGVTAGIGGGLYGSKQNIQAVQAALMMLKALGYFQYPGDYGDSYVLATVKQATEIGLFDGIDSSNNADLTRNEVAQMVLNALESDMVRFTGDPGVTYTGSNGESWVGGYKAEYTPRTSTDPKYNQLIDNKHSTDIDTTGQYYVQLGEELYNGDLVKRHDTDIFERPAYTWTYKTELIGTYVAKDKFLASYTTGVSGRTLYDLLNNITIKEYTLNVYVDGHAANNDDTYYSQYRSDYKKDGVLGANEEIDRDDLVRSNTDNVGATGRGVLTEVYLDRDRRIITIASIHTWLAQGTNTYSESKETASLRVFSNSADGTSKLVSVDDVPEVTGVAADGWYLVTMSDKDTLNLEVAQIMEPTVLTDSAVTKFTTGNKGDNGRVSKLTTDGTEYSNNVTSIYDDEVLDYYDASLLTDTTYNVYLDQYGYFVGVDIFDGNKAYVFITGYDMGSSNVSVKTATANGIFLDGTMKTMTVNVTDTNKAILRTYQDTHTNALTATPDGKITEDDTPLSPYYEVWGDNGNDGNHLLNRWYTYTTNEAGTYTLKPVFDITAKSGNIATAGNARMIATRVANGDELTVNCSKNVRLDGEITLTTADDISGGLNPGGIGTKTYAATGTPASQRAYGEDASVYITVDVGDVSPRTGGRKNAIGEVTGVYTGVQNVELVMEYSDREGAINEIPESIYTVFDKDGFIIGSIVLGTAKGTVANYAYITDAVKSERIEGDTYYWEFECIQGGEKKTLTAKSKFQSTIETLKDLQLSAAVGELRLDSDGYVIEVKEISASETDDKVYDNKDMKVNIDDENVYIVDLEDDDHNSYVDAVIGGASGSATSTANSTETAVLEFQRNTIYVLTGRHDKGLAFDSGAKAVVIQNEKGDTNVVTEFNSVRDALNHLADYNYDGAAAHDTPETLEYDGIIVAVLNSRGVAEWVIFKSNTELVAGANRPTKVDSGEAMYVQWEVSYNGGGAYVEYGSPVLVTKPAGGEGYPCNVTAPTIPGETVRPADATQRVPYRAGTTVVLQAQYTARAFSQLNITNPTTTIEVPYGGDITPAKAVDAGLEVEIEYDNGETVSVKAADMSFSNHTGLTGGGASATAVDATITVTVSTDSGNKSGSITAPYLNTATIPDTLGTVTIDSASTANIYDSGTSAALGTAAIQDLPKTVKVGDKIKVVYTATANGTTTDIADDTYNVEVDFTGGITLTATGTVVAADSADGATDKKATVTVEFTVASVVADAATGNITMKSA